MANPDPYSDGYRVAVILNPDGTWADFSGGGEIATVVQSNAALLKTTSIVAGAAASGASDAANPVTTGGRAATANPTAVADGQVVNAMHDKLGKAIVVSAVRVLKGVQTSVANGTTETTIVTADAVNFLDLYGLILANTSATATTVAIKDATAGTTRATLQVPAGDTRGFMLDPGAAIPQAIANNNWTMTSSASITSLDCTALFVKNL